VRLTVENTARNSKLSSTRGGTTPSSSSASRLGVVSGAHAGPGTLALFWLRDDDA